MIRPMNRAAVAAALAAVLAWGCSDDGEPAADSGAADTMHHQGDGGHGGLDEGACEHLTKGPHKNVTAGADAASAAEIKSDHHGYKVALTSGAAGFVKFAADASGDHALFLDQDIAVEVQDDKGAALSIEESLKSISACTEVKGKHTIELPAAGTYYFKLGPGAALTSVTLVIEEAGHSHP